MSYEPTNWKTGDVVTSAKLNKLEQGVAGVQDIFVVTLTGDEEHPVPDKTFQEVLSAINEGSIVLMKRGGSIVYRVSSIESDGNEVSAIVFAGPPIHADSILQIFMARYYTEDGTDGLEFWGFSINVDANG